MAVHRSRHPRRSPSGACEPRTRCVPSCPFMHGTAHWMAFSTLFIGGVVVIPDEHHLDPIALWRLIERGTGQLPRDRGRRVRAPAARRARHARGPRPRPLVPARRLVGRRDPVALAEACARRTPARRARRRRLRRVGDGRAGAVGRRRGRRRRRPPPRFRVGDDTQVLGDDLRPVGVGVVGRLARRGHIPLGYYKDPEKTADDVPGRRRRALGGSRRPRGRRDRRLDHTARSGLGLDQHRRREGVSRRGRVGAEGTSTTSSTPSSSGYPTNASANASSRSCRPASAPRRRSKRCNCTAAGIWPGTRCRATSSSSTRSSDRPRASPTTGGPERRPRARRVRSKRDRQPLAGETSPYLRQHADNPVDWYPWGDEAFALARDRDVPVFLSVGYSSCHWCHVMAHESFENDETAARDERPRSST